jgi:nucleoside-diphosphate-sugar epimerase
MKIAITGGAGFIGSHIARAYLDAGHDVFVIDTLVNGARKAVDPRALLPNGYPRWKTANSFPAGAS